MSVSGTLLTTYLGESPIGFSNCIPSPELHKNFTHLGHAIIREAVEDVTSFLRYAVKDPEGEQYHWGIETRPARTKQAYQSLGWLMGGKSDEEGGVTFLNACDLADCDPDLIREAIFATFEFSTAATRILKKMHRTVLRKERELEESAA